MSLRPLAMYNDDVHMESYSLKWKNINEKKIWTIDLIKNQSISDKLGYEKSMKIFG